MPTNTIANATRTEQALRGQATTVDATMLAMTDIFVEHSPLMRILPVLPGLHKSVEYATAGNDVPGTARHYNQEGVVNPGQKDVVFMKETVRLYETYIQNDHMLSHLQASDVFQRTGRLKGLANTISEDIFNNLNTANPERITGLRQRIKSPNLLTAGLTAGVSAPLSMRQLKRALDKTPGNRKIIVTEYETYINLENAAKSNRDGDIRLVKDDFGVEVPAFRGSIIVPVWDNSTTGKSWLDFDEVGVDGNTDTASMYIMDVSEGGASLFMGNVPTFVERGKTNTFDTWVYAMEIGLVIQNPDSIKRIWSITNGEVTD